MGNVRSALGVVAIGAVLSVVLSTGAVGAAVSKGQQVFVTNTPVTTLIASQSVAGGSITTFDVASYRTVRLYMRQVSCSGFGAAVKVTGGDDNRVLDAFNDAIGPGLTRAYEVPGTSIVISYSNDPSCPALVTLYGRNG